MKRIINGTIHLTTQDRSPLTSSNLQISDPFGSNLMSLVFDVNPIKSQSYRSIQLDLEKDITSGTHQLSDSGKFRSALYTENSTGEFEETNPSYSPAKSGALTITVTKTENLTVFNVSSFEIGVERHPDGKTRTLIGDSSISIEELN